MSLQEILDTGNASDSIAFEQSLLTDLLALEQMLEGDLLERDVIRRGAEQEMFLIDQAYRPAPIAPQVLSALSDSRFTTEIGKFNLEANLPPQVARGECLRTLETELADLVQRASAAAQPYRADVLLAGILPSVRLSDLGLHNLTEKPRYQELNRMVMDVRGGSYQLLIKGVDELQLIHENVMPEACCTSFQVHIQVDPRSFAADYNASLLAAAPVLAVAVNSPMLLGRRLWQETRIALFQHSVDERTHSRIARSHPARVSFGEGWVRNSVLEIYREQIARFRTIMRCPVGEDSLEVLRRGGVPKLQSLVLHNGTIWRWNRPCFGITDGRPHLRLEFRALPAGPTVLDEVANAALSLGLVRGLPQEYGNVASKIQFDDAKDNFFSAARHGLNAQLRWVDGKHYSVCELLENRLLALASEGLRELGINSEDRDRYLGVIHERVASRQTGSSWLLSAANAISNGASQDGCGRRLTAILLARQKSERPVHEWAAAANQEIASMIDARETVGEIMSTDLFTVTAADPIILAASLMDWRRIRHLPVEENGRLAGLVSSREIFHFMAAPNRPANDGKPGTVADVMNSNVLTVKRETPIAEALQLMLDNQVDCLPVTEGNQLIGIVTSQDLLEVLSAVLKRDKTE